MPLTEAQIVQIRERCAGWEVAWWKLYVDLRDHLSTSTKELVLPVPWSDYDREDFISHLLQGYDRRARNGLLLTDFDSSQRDPVTYLTSPDLLRKRAISFLKQECGPLRRHLRRQGKKLKSLDACAPLANTIPGTGPDAAQGRTSDELDRDLRAGLERILLAVPDEGKITRVVEQAGMQLYPRLDLSETSMQRLVKHLAVALADPSPEWPDRLTMLSDHHATAKQDWDQQIDRLCERIYNNGKGVSPKTDRLLRNRLDKMSFDAVFLPLGAAFIMRLLGITQSDAAQRRRRYRTSLPHLLPHLKRLHQDGDDSADTSFPPTEEDDQ